MNDAPTPAPQPKRSAREWLFQLTTITVGVLIALAFDGLLRWNADRELVAQARATIALEIADNRRELEAHLAAHDGRIARLDPVLKLLDELDAGVEPTVREIELGFGFPSLSDAGWQTAEQTGALALMDYPDVQMLAELYLLQDLVTDNMSAMLITVHGAASSFTGSGDPFAMPPSVRDAMRAHVYDLRAHLALDEQLGRQLLEAYREYVDSEAKG
jgi:hypothetical protein